eukprot:1139233-Pelagomonas_calceolata.AAC.1
MLGAILKHVFWGELPSSDNFLDLRKEVKGWQRATKLHLEASKQQQQQQQRVLFRFITWALA